MPERQVELPLLVSCSGSDGISSDSLMVAGIGAGYNSVGLTARSTVGFINGLERKSSDSTAVDGLELGTNYDGCVVAPMVVNSFFSAGFLSYSHEVTQMGANGCSTDGFNSIDFTQGLGKTLMVNSQLLKGIFLADILKRLLAVGFVEFGVNRGVNVGSECGLSVLDTSMVEEVALPVMVLDKEESLAVCDPLLTVIPPGWLCQWM